MKWRLFLAVLLLPATGIAQITITVSADKGHLPVSPFIYGVNDFFIDSARQWHLCREAGVRLYRQHSGNNATKYNWKKKLTSHPDWYNNVYPANWEALAESLLTNTNASGIFTLPLLGKAASTNAHNFDTYAYDGNQGSNNHSNWAGGGGPALNGQPEKSGNPDLYLQDWPADSSTGILDHWFKELKLDSNRLRYWNMDNEPDFWSFIHDDIATSAITAEEVIQKYIAVAKLARKKFPGIKLTGFVAAVEPNWYLWNSTRITDKKDSKSYTWIEYFIKRIAEEQQISGLRLLDVIDVHFYPPSAPDPATTLQFHRVWFDTTYSFPGAYGVKAASTKIWDTKITEEYFFLRCKRWLFKYMGPNHGVTFGVTESGGIASEANVAASWYASNLGVFASNGVELFTPFYWHPGQWEVLHLFSTYFGKIAVQTNSDKEETVSAYASLSGKGDSLIVVVVNRNQVNHENVTLNIAGYSPSASVVNGFELSGLPTTETFISKTQNALQRKQYVLSGNSINLILPELSVTMLQIPTLQPVLGTETVSSAENFFSFYPNPANETITLKTSSSGTSIAIVSDLLLHELCRSEITSNAMMDISELQPGTYLLTVKGDKGTITRKFIKY